MKTKVLIIKHDTKAATELRQQLAKNKDICVCDIISDGGNAVSAIRAQNPNVILLDFLLPNLDGEPVDTASCCRGMPARFDLHKIHAGEMLIIFSSVLSMKNIMILIWKRKS